MQNMSTDSPNATDCKDLAYTKVTKVVLPVLYFFVFIGGLLLNALATWIFCHISSQSSFVVYLKNIVTTDVMMLITLPFKILSDSHLGPWQLKAFVCRYNLVLFYGNMYLSIMFLGLISFDRYLKIAWPTKNFMVQKVIFAKVISAGCWVFIMGSAVISIILTNMPSADKITTQCFDFRNEQSKNWYQFTAIKCQVIFWITFVLLMLCYSAIFKKIYWSDQKLHKDSSNMIKKVNRNIFSTMGVFTICFVPYHIMRLVYKRPNNQKGCTTYDTLYYAKEFSKLLCAINVCLDPIIYFLLCKLFTKLLFKKMRVKQGHEIEMSL
ncbi:P2Y purinoceptor 14-like [Cetorhinus maximus]